MTKKRDRGEGFQEIGGLIQNVVKEYKPLTLVEKRLIKNSTEIRTFPPEEVNFLHSLSCQTILPYRSLPERVWEHANGRANVRVEAGSAYHPDSDKFIELPVPFGPKARLVQIHLDTEAIRTQCPEIEVGDSMTAFASSILGYEPNGRELRALKTQLGSLSAATIRIANTGDKPFQITSVRFDLVDSKGLKGPLTVRV